MNESCKKNSIFKSFEQLISTYKQEIKCVETEECKNCILYKHKVIISGETMPLCDMFCEIADRCEKTECNDN